MKTIRLLTIITFVLGALLLAGCSGLQKMKKNAGLIEFKTTPKTLETHAGKVDMAIDARFPAKYFDKKTTIVATPVLKYDGGETPFNPVTVQGESVKANNKVISYSGGGSVSYKGTTVYNKEMSLSDLEVRMVASRGAKNLTFDPVKIAKGVISTSTFYSNAPKAILGVRREANNTGKYDPNIDPFQRIVPDELIADIHYLINQSKLREEETEAPDVKKIQEYTKEAYNSKNKELKGVQVSAYASPDGTIDLNTELAAKRKDTSAEFIKESLKKAGVETNLKTRYTPEDWEGFKELMEKSNIRDKDLILRVLSMYTDPEVREREIKNLSFAFTSIAENILPQLRRAKILTSIEMIGKADEEILALAQSNPASLNPAELLYAATLTNNLDKKLTIYNSFIKIYPEDWRGPNNAGYVLVNQGKYTEAKPLFEKAEKLKSNEPIVKNNLGAIAVYEGDLKKGEEYLGIAAGSGPEVNYNQGLLNLKKGEYSRAVRYFDESADPNSALAKIMNGDTNGALKDLEAYSVSGDYRKEYLKAVIGARTAKENLLMESLKAATGINPEMKAKAKNDMEFAEYFDNAKFKSIVQ